MMKHIKTYLARLAPLFLVLAVQPILTGCAELTSLQFLTTVTPSPTPIPTLTATAPSTPTLPATATPTSTPTPSPTPTPAIVIHKPPKPRDLAEPEPTPIGDLVASTKHVDFYAQPNNFWAQQIEDIGPAIEAELRRVAERLQADLPEHRLRVSLQDPSSSPLVRGMNCPARGLYYGHTESGSLTIIFADQNTRREQVMAVVAHEFAHHMTFEKLGNGGDIILSEGLANWASLDTWTLWQGWSHFDAAVRDYRRRDLYLPLEETLTFDPSTGRELGLSDCFALRDLRYNEWASFVDYLIGHYGFETIVELWQAAPDDQQYLRRGRAPTVEYESVLGKNLQQLEQDWLAALGNQMQQAALRSSIP